MYTLIHIIKHSLLYACVIVKVSVPAPVTQWSLGGIVCRCFIYLYSFHPFCVPISGSAKQTWTTPIGLDASRWAVKASAILPTLTSCRGPAGWSTPWSWPRKAAADTPTRAGGVAEEGGVEEDGAPVASPSLHPVSSRALQATNTTTTMGANTREAARDMGRSHQGTERGLGAWSWWPCCFFWRTVCTRCSCVGPRMARARASFPVTETGRMDRVDTAALLLLLALLLLGSSRTSWEQVRHRGEEATPVTGTGFTVKTFSLLNSENFSSQSSCTQFWLCK